MVGKWSDDMFGPKDAEAFVGPPTYEYRCESINLADAWRLLNAWAAEGWRLQSSHVVMVKTRSDLDVQGPAAGMGLFVILERVKA